MSREGDPRKSRWCIVAADDAAPEWVAYGALEARAVPVQYGRLGGTATLLHLALLRAASIAPTSQIVVTALDEYRDLWEPTLWCVRPEMRLVSDKRTSSLLASAAAILSIANTSPSAIVTMLPARCYVGHECILRQAIRHVVSELPRIPQGVATLGMVDIDVGVDEDYMLVGRAGSGPGLSVQGIARRPTAWVARHLRRQGAVVCSGIMIGYAGVLAAHISKHWPGFSEKVTTMLAMARAARRECEIPRNLQNRMPSCVLKSLRWHPPALPQRVFTVSESGWSGLKSPYAVTRVAEFVASAVDRHDELLTRSSSLSESESMAL
jgi:mannose-1-phosphate guanylyltransferase